MDDIWIPKDKLKLQYGDKIRTVRFGETSLAVPAPLEQVGSFCAIGGQISSEPMELEQKIINLYLGMFGCFENLAIKFFRAKKEYLVFTSEPGGVISFEYVVGLVHEPEALCPYCQDSNIFNRMLHYISSEFKRAYIVRLLDVSKSLITRDIESYRYDTTVVGCLDSVSKRQKIYRIGSDF